MQLQTSLRLVSRVRSIPLSKVAVLLGMAACATPDAECPDEQLLSVQGNCITVEPQGYDDEIVAHIPACELGEPSTRLDITAGCADGICADMTYGEMVAGYGEEGVCTNYGGGYSHCDFADGAIGTVFVDDDNDAVPDAGNTSSIFLDETYSGTTLDGVGLGQSMACFLDTMRYTDRYETVEGRLSEVQWTEPFSAILSDNDVFDSEIPDGYADRLALFGR
jgi:hypothetical protein